MLKIKTKLETVYLWMTMIFVLGLYAAQFIYFGHIEKFDPNTAQEFSNSTSRFNKLSEQDYLKSIRDSFNKSSKDALVEFEKLEKNIKELDSEIIKAGSADIVGELAKYREIVSQIVVMPDVHEVLSIFSKKITAFSEVANKNSWKNLAKSSSRISQRLSGAAARPATFFARMETSVADIEKELNYMRDLTERANLSAADKTFIHTKLGAMRPEYELLSRFAGVWKLYLDGHSAFSRAYADWVKDAGEKIGLKSIKKEKVSQQYYYSNILGLGLILIAIIFIPFVSKSANRARKNLKEAELINQLKGSFLGHQNSENIFSSENNRREFDKVQDYVLKRMSFGTIFQDSIPFPTLILDSNLAMVWCNTHFMEKWSLGHIQNGESISWDYLRKNTNMDDVEPLNNALNHHIAGIYQVQLIKKDQDNSDTTEPFEMYVSPIEYQGQTRITVIFYPLASMEQTISDQARSLMGPIRKTLDSLNSGRIQDAFEEQVYADYKLAGISEIYEKFIQLSDQHETVKHGLLEQIEDCENQICDLLKVITDSMSKIQEQKEKLTNTNHAFVDIKNSIIASVEERAKIQAINEELLNIVKQKDNKLSGSTKALIELKSIKDDTAKVVENVRGLRAPLKETKILLEDSKGRIGQNLDMLLSSTNSKLDGKNLEYLKRVKEEFENMVSINSKLASWLPVLDLSFSKLEILFSQRNNEIIPNELLNHNDVTDSESFSFQARKVDHNLNLVDAKIISTLKEFYSSIQAMKKTNNDLNGLVEQDFLRDKANEDQAFLEG